MGRKYQQVGSPVVREELRVDEDCKGLITKKLKPIRIPETNAQTRL